MDITKSRTFRIAFLVDADSLRRLSKLLQEDVLDQMPEDSDRRISCKVDLSDGSSVDKASMEDVLDLPNSSMRKITSIRISTPYVYSPVHASIRLSDNSYLPVSYDLSGEERHVIPLAYSLDDHLLSLRQWYSFLTRYSFIGVFAVVYLAVFVLANLAVASDFLFPSLLPGEASSDSETDPGLQAAFWAVIVLVIGAILGLDWVRTKAFPIGTFAIGQGIARHKRLNYLRGIFLTGIALPILTGLIVAAVP